LLTVCYTVSNMRSISKRIVAVNTLGLLGYMSMLVSWLLLLAVVFVMIVNSPLVVTEHTVITTSGSPMPQEMSGIAQFASYGVTAVVIVVSISVFVTLPYFMSRGMSRLMRRILGALAISATWWHMWLIKALAAVIPCVAFLAVSIFNSPQDTTIPLFVVVFFASLLSTGIFLLQYFTALRLRVAPSAIW
jgi:hypothetical protein